MRKRVSNRLSRKRNTYGDKKKSPLERMQIAFGMRLLVGHIKIERPF